MLAQDAQKERIFFIEDTKADKNNHSQNKIKEKEK